MHGAIHHQLVYSVGVKFAAHPDEVYGEALEPEPEVFPMA
jgi:hypothetical protein